MKVRRPDTTLPEATSQAATIAAFQTFAAGRGYPDARGPHPIQRSASAVGFENRYPWNRSQPSA